LSKYFTITNKIYQHKHIEHTGKQLICLTKEQEQDNQILNQTRNYYDCQTRNMSKLIIVSGRSFASIERKRERDMEQYSITFILWVTEVRNKGCGLRYNAIHGHSGDINDLHGNANYVNSLWIFPQSRAK